MGMDATKRWSNLGYIGYVAQLVHNSHNDVVILGMSPKIFIVPMVRYDEILDEMIEYATDVAEDWCYIWDSHLVEGSTH